MTQTTDKRTIVLDRKTKEWEQRSINDIILWLFKGIEQNPDRKEILGLHVEQGAMVTTDGVSIRMCNFDIPEQIPYGNYTVKKTGAEITLTERGDSYVEWQRILLQFDPLTFPQETFDFELHNSKKCDIANSTSVYKLFRETGKAISIAKIYSIATTGIYEWTAQWEPIRPPNSDLFRITDPGKDTRPQAILFKSRTECNVELTVILMPFRLE